MLCRGGGLLYVDMEAVKNSCYGFLGEYTVTKSVYPQSGTINFKKKIVVYDYVHFLKTGENKISEGWQIYSEYGGILTLLKYNYSFRARYEYVEQIQNHMPTQQKIVEPIIMDDNPQLYEELKQNASWL